MFLFGLVFNVPIIIFQSCLDGASASRVLNQCSGSLLEAFPGAQHVYIAALGFHALSSGCMLYQSTTVYHIQGWFPSFICFSYFQFLEQEFSFNYESSSSFLTLHMNTISDFIYVKIICIFF